MAEKTYYEEQNSKGLKHLRGLIETLPPFVSDFSEALDKKTLL